MSARTPRTSPAETLEQDVDELFSLLWETLAGLKRASPPPEELREVGRRASLTARHMPAVLAVAAGGPLSVSELARRLGLSLSSTSAIVGELSRTGLLERAEDDADRRRTIVRLDEKYGEAIGTWAVQSLTPLRDTLERLPPKARAQFLEGWRILHEEATRGAWCEEEECGT
jgi:DNA-binding MarR family transcriptional regulator